MQITKQIKLLIVSGNSENEDISNKHKLSENESIEFTYSNLINQQVNVLCIFYCIHVK